MEIKTLIYKCQTAYLRKLQSAKCLVVFGFFAKETLFPILASCLRTIASYTYIIMNIFEDARKIPQFYLNLQKLLTMSANMIIIVKKSELILKNDESQALDSPAVAPQTA